MQSSKENSPLSKNSARSAARNVWKDFLQNPSLKSALTENLIGFINSLESHSRVLAYIALPDEMDIMSLLIGSLFRIYIPMFDDKGNMEFALYSESGNEPVTLRRGLHGIWMPEQNANILKLPLDETDTVFIPSMAASENGFRLGRGGGYYDRWKSRMARSRLVGILPSQLAELKFHTENHDIKLHLVITENGVVEYK